MSRVKESYMGVMASDEKGSQREIVHDNRLYSVEDEDFDFESESRL